MWKQQRLIVLIVGMGAAIAAHPAQAQEKTSLNSSVSEMEQPLTEAKWLTQALPPPEAAKEQVAQVTAVQLKPTEKGVEVILETAAEFPEVLTSSSENSLITDIPNAQLRLPGGRAFRQDNPTQAIASVEVTNLDAKTLRVTVTGKAGVPIAEVSQSPQALILSIAAPPAPPAPIALPATPEPTPAPAPTVPPVTPAPKPQADEDLLQLEVKAEEEAGGYNVPDATTATRTDTPLRDIPQSIQVVPREVIEDQQINRISDAVRNVSGVTPGVQDFFEYYNIRGFDTFTSLRNGFSYRSQGAGILAENIEQVEVLKGPASVLYGQFEPGGVVNYITKQPLNEPYYFGEFRAGSDNFYGPSIDISGPLTGDDKLLYRLNVAYTNSGSFVDFVNQESFLISPVFTYKIGDSTTLGLSYDYINLSGTTNPNLPPDPIVFEAPINRFLGEPDDYTEATTHFINSLLTHRFNDTLEFRSSFSVQLERNQSSAFGPLSVEPDGRTVIRRYSANVANDVDAYSLQNNLIAKFNTGSIKHQLLLGFDWIRRTRPNPYLEVGDTAPIDLFDPVYGAPVPTEFGEGSSEQTDETTT